MKLSDKFRHDANHITFDLKHRQTIAFNMSKYDAAVKRGLNNYDNLALAKDRAAFIKRKMLSNWSQYLEEFETKFTQKGGVVHWASDSAEACQHLENILKPLNPSYVMKSKSMTTEEIHFNEFTEEIGIKPIETDLGEFIVQVAGEKPYHILTPAMHKSKEDVAKLFHEKFKTPEQETPENLTRFVREYLRKKFIHLEVGVTGANYLIAETGSVCLTENEGNGLMSTAFPKIHIVIAGIEKIIPKLSDLSTLWPLLAHAGTGQKMTVYNSIFTPENPEQGKNTPQMHIILLDNGRTDLFETKDQFDALSCIRCGACLNNCPIYHNVGGYAYNTEYSGPIGSVITPHMKKDEGFAHLSFACSLCGKCKEACPVKINLPELLLLNRKESQKTRKDEFTMHLATNLLAERKRLDAIPTSLKNTSLKLAGKQILGKWKKLSEINQDSFSKQYQKKSN